ncbi:MAG TPA: phosphoribosylglycinamide formyltransferase 2 [Gammaproteobacteria bacterium]|nr:phosphoribosylglycinamide formyltransferase 2 [Gammaproteobacteria bacterium]|tara:strand:+ start:85 stop:1275 length:1191 start_codon:yes stop_codon:yes gene_type:complete
MINKSIGTAGTSGAVRLLLLGAGELGKEVAIEALRYGLEVTAVDRYDNAPAMQVAQHSHVMDMLNGDALEMLVEQTKPDLIVPEVEAIATERLVGLEERGYYVVPTARATRLTMDREGIRRLAAEELKLPTSPYRFAESENECVKAIEEIGVPCIVKPVMSSSGKGQVVVEDGAGAASAWSRSVTAGRGIGKKVIVEGFVHFDYEITLLTVRHSGGTSFCKPIGHLQIDGDYRESWQPQSMSVAALDAAKHVAHAVTKALGGNGIFGVELFVQGDNVFFSEVSPRPHDTGMVTMLSQDLSEFALHVRAILGLPIPAISQKLPAASVAVLGYGSGENISYEGIGDALREVGTELRIFGKSEVRGKRRLAVALASADSVEEARDKARGAAEKVKIIIS